MSETSSIFICWNSEKAISFVTWIYLIWKYLSFSTNIFWEFTRPVGKHLTQPVHISHIWKCLRPKYLVFLALRHPSCATIDAVVISWMFALWIHGVVFYHIQSPTYVWVLLQCVSHPVILYVQNFLVAKAPLWWYIYMQFQGIQGEEELTGALQRPNRWRSKLSVKSTMPNRSETKYGVVVGCMDVCLDVPVSVNMCQSGHCQQKPPSNPMLTTQHIHQRHRCIFWNPSGTLKYIK